MSFFYLLKYNKSVIYCTINYSGVPEDASFLKTVYLFNKKALLDYC